jgi:ribonuclease HI
MAKTKYYAVHIGRKTGVVKEWSKCEKYIKGYTNAKYKAFPNQESALYFVEHGVLPNLADIESNVSFDADFTIYIDSSCKGNPGPSAVGIVIYEVNSLYKVACGKYLQTSTNNRAELMSLHEALKISKRIVKGGHKVIIYTDSMYSLSSTDKWYRDSSETKNNRREHGELIRAIFQLRLELKDFVKVSHVKAHSGIKGNELADKAARYCLEQKVEALRWLSQSGISKLT